MIFDIRHPFTMPPLFVVPGDIVRFPNGREVHDLNDDEGSSQMGDEGCPNESQSVNDATGYSKEDEEEASSISCDEVL
jgi:hypothetical protein